MNSDYEYSRYDYMNDYDYSYESDYYQTDYETGRRDGRTEAFGEAEAEKAEARKAGIELGILIGKAIANTTADPNGPHIVKLNGEQVFRGHFLATMKVYRSLFNSDSTLNISVEPAPAKLDEIPF